MEATEKQLAQARKTINSICAMLAESGTKYTLNDEKLYVKVVFASDDFPIEIYFRARPENELLTVTSVLPFSIPEDGRVNVAVAAMMLNSSSYDGTWSIDLSDGYMSFIITNSYIDSILGKECFHSLMGLAYNATKMCADKFFILGKGYMTVQQFCQSVFGEG